MEQISKRLVNWASILDPATREQAEKASRMPFIFPHLALMPDAHLGKGATVGSVIPTLGAIIPAAVGVDIGCGMIAVRTQFTEADFRARPLAPLRRAIERAVPLSAGKYNTKLTDTARDRVDVLAARAQAAGFDPGSYAGNWALQLGTLGSGNHFIEVTLDETGRVWLFLHSGSRGVGNKIAQKHIRIAHDQCERRWIDLPDPDLAYLVEGEEQFWRYIREMRWAQDFAWSNREEMMDRVVACVADWTGRDVERQETVNCFAGETQVITRTGTRPIEALADGVHELLTAGGEWVKAPVRSFGRQEVHEVVLGRSGAVKTIRATAGHRWLLRSRRGHEYEATTAELKPGERLQHTFPRRPVGLAVDHEAAARGFVYGRVSGNRSTANAGGPEAAAVLRLFDRLDGSPAEWTTERPDLDAPADVIHGWLAGRFAAAGAVGETGRPTLASASREDLEFVRTACQAVGIGTFGIRTRLRTGHDDGPGALHLVGLMRGDLDPEFFLVDEHRARFEASRHAAEQRGWTVLSVRPTGETTEVYCAVVEDTHSFALGDNILTGNCHHNYTEQETHFGKQVWLSRKGAINAEEGRPGLIPGSMGTASYVVVGKGNRMALNSSPHGAGREYSRSAARRAFDRDDLRRAMVGIEYRDTDAFIDEIPAAYKDIDVVMHDARDLVEVRHTLRQLVNVKGD
ncbi:RtcB family protein [Actinosynnema sp. NPDC023658]|uniref:RtcB family protein n=1 Tax=Actinosynnema sp. NPDC023658 TaxID=3155465 RepID=UPI0033CDCDAE